MVRFYGLCDGKIIGRKAIDFWFLRGKVFFFRKNLGARYLIVKCYWLITCSLWN